MALRFLPKVRTFNVSNIRYLFLSPAVQKLTQFVLTDIGEGIREVTIREWFVNVGDKIAQFDNICLVESDKASVNITSRYDGVIKGLYYQVGDIALVGKPLIDVDTLENEQKEIGIPSTGDSTSILKNVSLPEIKNEDIFENSFENKKLATPAVRRMAMEHNISIKEVAGSGKAGRILKEDLLNFLNKHTKPAETFVEAEETKIPVSGIKKVMVKTMTESSKIPTFGYYDEINVTKLVELRNDLKEVVKSKGINLTYMPFFIKALSKCIQKYPELNSALDVNCENIILKNYHNIGIAVDTPKGLVVPNIKNVQNLSIAQINHELNIIMENGRQGKLLPNDMSKGTISISNIGAIGGTYAVPLINPPEVCILAIGKFKPVPLITDDNKIEKSMICCLSWTADHRVIDGATMAKFSNLFKDYLENPSHLMIDL